MRLLLMRHGDAGERDPVQWPDDTMRPLTPRGRKRHGRMARRLRRRGLVPALILASPWRRAWQAARLTAEATGAPGPMACPALTASPDLPAIAAAIGNGPPDRLVALVGHHPWMAELASLLLTGDPRRLAIDFPKSAIIGLEADTLEPGRARLVFFWRPREH